MSYQWIYRACELLKMVNSHTSIFQDSSVTTSWARRGRSEHFEGGSESQTIITNNKRKERIINSYVLIVSTPLTPGMWGRGSVEDENWRYICDLRLMQIQRSSRHRVKHGTFCTNTRDDLYQFFTLLRHAGTLPSKSVIDKKSLSRWAVKHSSKPYRYHNAHSVCWKHPLPLHRHRSYRKYGLLYYDSRSRSHISYRYVVWHISQCSSILYVTRSPGVFKQILPLASTFALRIICLSRREYEGSTPYSEDELKTIHDGSEAERADFFRNEGTLIALFVDEIIQSLSLPKKGGVTVVGWSLGNLYTIAMRASINDLPDNTKQRLKEYTRGFVVLGLYLLFFS